MMCDSALTAAVSPEAVRAFFDGKKDRHAMSGVKNLTSKLLRRYFTSI
jgi:hypothetical protein